jgi:hypothetical protein
MGRTKKYIKKNKLKKTKTFTSMRSP